MKLKRSNKVSQTQEYIDAITVIRQCFAMQRILKMFGSKQMTGN